MLETINTFTAISAVAIQTITLISILLLVIGFKVKFLDFIKTHFLLLGTAITFFTLGFNLYYSEIVGFAPCFLCWLQRIFLFPQIVLFGVGYLHKDRKVINYALPLLISGALIAMYHVYTYYFIPASGAPCDASGVSCNQILISELGGYISMPTLSLTIFMALIALCVVAMFYKKGEV